MDLWSKSIDDCNVCLYLFVFIVATFHGQQSLKIIIVCYVIIRVEEGLRLHTKVHTVYWPIRKFISFINVFLNLKGILKTHFIANVDSAKLQKCFYNSKSVKDFSVSIAINNINQRC